MISKFVATDDFIEEFSAGNVYVKLDNITDARVFISAIKEKMSEDTPTLYWPRIYWPRMIPDGSSVYCYCSGTDSNENVIADICIAEYLEDYKKVYSYEDVYERCTSKDVDILALDSILGF